MGAAVRDRERHNQQRGVKRADRQTDTAESPPSTRVMERKTDSIYTKFWKTQSTLQQVRSRRGVGWGWGPGLWGDRYINFLNVLKPHTLIVSTVYCMSVTPE